MNEQGIKITEIEQNSKDVISESALRNVKLALIFAEIAKLEQISVSEEELEEVLLSIANSQKTSVSKVKKYYKDNNLMDDVRVK